MPHAESGAAPGKILRRVIEHQSYSAMAAEVVTKRENYNPTRRGERVMVTYVMQWNVAPTARDAYSKWSKNATARVLAAPGLLEFRGYRQAVGTAQLAATFEFGDMAGFTSWFQHPDIQEFMSEMREFTMDRTTALWASAPDTPDPIRRSS